MKTLLLFFVLFIGNFVLNAQITITSADVSNFFSTGNFTTIHEYDGAQINIGSPGGPNNWDFSGLQTTSTFTYESVNPGSSSYIGEFPGANVALHSQRVYLGEPGDGYSYLEVTGNLLNNIGQAVVFNSQPGNLYVVKNSPADALILPITYNNGYQEQFTQTIYLNGSPIKQDSIYKVVIIDAWGTMILPGGQSFDALRIKEVRSVNGVPDGVHYSFQSANGAQVNMQTSDPNAPDLGIIDIAWYDWNVAFTTDVEQTSGLPSDFSLVQNYPNPFNPSTTIRYTIPNVTLSPDKNGKGSRVQLKVYDVLGKEVATLVNEEKPAGQYEVNFDAGNLSSGVYFYKLQAGSFVETKKMILLK
jgi:hypothetical protein